MKTLNSIKPTLIKVEWRLVKATKEFVAKALFNHKLNTTADTAKLLDLEPMLVDALVKQPRNNLVALTKSELPALYEQLAA